MSLMTLNQLSSDLRDSLGDAVNILTDEDKSQPVERLILLAAHDFGRVRQRTLLGDLTLVADQSEYPAPDDLIQPKSVVWGDGRNHNKYWENDYPGIPPVLSLAEHNGSRVLLMRPPPSTKQIMLVGATCSYYYLAGHVVGETEAETSVQASDRGLLILRAQAEAMLELSIRNSHKPVQIRDGMSQAPKNGTPAALYDQLMKQFERQSRAH